MEESFNTSERNIIISQDLQNKSINCNDDSRAPSEPVFSSHYPEINHREVSVPCNDHYDENVGIGAANTIDIYLCIEDKNKNGNESKQEEDQEEALQKDVLQTHNKYMSTNISKKQFYFAPYNTAQDTNWHLFEYDDIFLSESSFLSDIFCNVIEPLVQRFKDGESGCLVLYSPDKTAWNDRLQLFDIMHQILLQLNIAALNCNISSYQINDDNAHDLLPIKATHSSSKYSYKSNILQFSRSKINRSPLKLSLNRSLHYVLENINKIGIRSIETGLQYFERSHNLYKSSKSSKSSHYVFCIKGCDHDQELRIVQLCTADPMRNQALLNMRQCVKVIKHNKTKQNRLKQSLYVPFRRHIFTKLFQPFIDGTSSFSFLFYLPPIHTYKIEKKLYLDRILSLLNYSFKTKRISESAPFITQHNNTLESTMESQVSGKLLTHKNQTIQQLSKQIETVHNDYQKENEKLRNKIKKLKAQNDKDENESNQYRKQIHVLHNEMKVRNKNTNQIKYFVSEITNLLQIDLDKTQHLSWNDILHKVSQQKKTIESQKNEIKQQSLKIDEITPKHQAVTKLNALVDIKQEEVNDLKLRLEDKENLEIVNKRLKQQTNVYRFQSAAHQKMAESVKLQKNKLKSEVIQLLENHAPNDEIKNIFKDITHRYQDKRKEIVLVQPQNGMDALQYEVRVKQEMIHKLCKHLFRTMLISWCYKYKCNYKKSAQYCNDPTHEHKIVSLTRKFTMMCLQMDKVQIESLDYVQKAADLRDENIKLKKQNRRNRRGIKCFQKDIKLQITDVSHDVIDGMEQRLAETLSLFETRCDALSRNINYIKISLYNKQNQVESATNITIDIKTFMDEMRQSIKHLMRLFKHEYEETETMLSKTFVVMIQRFNQSLEGKNSIIGELKTIISENKEDCNAQKVVHNRLQNEVFQQKELLEELSTSNHKINDECDALKQIESEYNHVKYVNEQLMKDIAIEKHKLKEEITKSQTIKNECDDKMKTQNDAYQIKMEKWTESMKCMQQSLDETDRKYEDKDTEYTAKIQQQHVEIAILTENVEKKMETIDSLQFEIKDKESQYLVDIHNMKQELNDIKQQNIDRMKKVEREMEGKHIKDISAKNEEIELLQNKLKKETEKNHTLTAQLSEKQTECESLQNSSLNDKNEWMEAEINAWQKECDQIKDLLQQRQEEMDRMKTLASENATNRRRVEQEIEETHTKDISAKNEEIQWLENKVKKEIEKYDTITAQLLEEQTERESIQNSLLNDKNEWMEAVTKYKNEKDEYLAQIHKMEQELHDIKQRNIEQNNEYTDEIKGYKQDIKGKTDEINTLKVATQKALKTEKEMKSETSAKTKKLKQKENEYNHHLMALKTENDANIANIETLHKENESLTQQKDKFKSINHGLLQKLKVLKECEQCLKKDMAEISEKHTKLLNNVQNMKNEYDNTIKKQKDEYHNKMEECTQNMKQSLDETDRKYKDKNEEDTAKIKQQHAEIATLTEDVGKNMKRIDSLQLEIKDKESQYIEEMNALKESNDQEIQMKEKELQKKKELIEIMAEKEREYNQTIQELKKEHQALEDIQSDIQNQLKIKRQKLEENNLNTHEYEKTIDNLQTQLKEAQKQSDQENMERTETNNKYELKLESTQNELHILQESLNATQSQLIPQMEHKIKVKNEEMNTLECELQKDKDRMHKMETTLSEKQEEMDKKEMEYNQNMQHLKQEMKVLKDAKHDGENKLRLLTLETQTNMEISTKKDDEIRTLNSNVSTLTQKYETLRSECTKSKTNQQTLQENTKMMDALKEQLKSADDSVHTLQQSMAIKQKQSEKEQKENDEKNENLGKMVETLQNENIKWKTQNDHTESMLDQIKLNNAAEMETLCKQLQQKDDDLKRVEMETTEWMEKISELQEEIQEKQTDNDELTMNRNEAEKTIETLHSKYNKHQTDKGNQVHKLQNEYQQIKETLDNKQQEMDTLRKEAQQKEDMMQEIQKSLDIMEINKKKIEEHHIKDINTKNEEMQLLQTQLTEETGKYDEWRKKQNKLENEWMEAATKYKNKISECAEERGNLEKQCNRYKKDVQSIMDEKNGLCTKYDDVLQVNANQTETLSEKQQEMDKREMDYNQNTEDLSKANDELRSMNEHLENEISQQKELRNVISTNKDEIDSKYNEQKQLTKDINDELKKTKKERDKYYKDKQLLQQEMQLISHELDELNESKTHLMAQIEQLMEFQINTAQLKKKIEQYSQMTACTQQRIKQLESMKNALEKDNVMQIQKTERVFAENESLKQEITQCDAQITKLKHCIINKLNSVTHILRSKDMKINELSSMLTERNEEIDLIKNEMQRKLQFEDENEMLHKYKHKLEAQIEELNRNLNGLHSKHRVLKQCFDKTNKTNQKMQCGLRESRVELQKLHHEVSGIKHENEQIEKCSDHYKNKLKTTLKQCTLLRKKTVVFRELIHLGNNEITELQFDMKSTLHKVCTILLEIKDMEHCDCDCVCNDELYCLGKQRIDDLKTECNHYKEMLRLNDENNLDLKQQSVLYSHQMLENWQKIFEKVSSMINIKSYTIEILQKRVSDINDIMIKDKDVEREKEINGMKDDVRKLEAKHRKEKIELKGLLDREVYLAHSQRDSMEKELNVYRSKLQSFYKKHSKSREKKEQKKFSQFMDNMRHEMNQISQENVTMATVTNSLREIVRKHLDKTQKLETQNEEMYQDIRGFCQYMQQISGETILSEDEENMYNASNLSEMVSVVKQRALSISSSRSSLQQEPIKNVTNDVDDVDDDDYTMINHNDAVNQLQCPICDQEFNPMVWKYKCVACVKYHCSLCAPLRQDYNDESKCRVCHQCFE